MRNQKKTVPTLAVLLVAITSLSVSACSVEIEKDKPSDTTIETTGTTN